MTEDLFSWSEQKDPLAEFRLYADFTNIVEGMIVRKNLRYPVQYIEEIKQDVVSYCFTNIIKKIKEEYRECPSAVFGFIQKGIYFILIDTIKKYAKKQGKINKNRALLLESNKIQYHTGGESSNTIEDNIVACDSVMRMHRLAMRRTKEKLTNTDRDRCGIILNYIEDNELYDLLLDFKEFATLFDLKSFTKYKICGTYQLEMKQVLTEEYRGEKMAFEFDDTDYTFDDDIEDSVFEEEEEEITTTEEEEEVKVIPSEEIQIVEDKPKTKKKAKSVNKEVVKAETKDRESIQDTENFSPDLDGERASEITKELAKNWIMSSHKLGKILYRAKLHYGKSKEDFVNWVQVHCKIAYSTAMSIIKVGQLSEDTLKLLVERKFTSTHVTKLQSLKYEDQQIDFLKQHKHKIDEEGNEVETKNMTSKDVQSAVRLINQKPEPKKSGSELFWDTVKKVNNFLTNNSDEFITQVLENKKVKLEVYTPEQIAAIQNLCSTLKWFKEDYDEVIMRLFPNKEE